MNTERTWIMPCHAACRCKILWNDRDWYFLRYVTTSGPITESRTKLHSDWSCWWPKWDTMMDNSPCKARRGRGVLSRKWCWQTKAMSNTVTSLLISFPLLPFLLPLTTMMSSADGKSVRPFLLKISPLMFPTDNCARTMDINAIAKVSLSLKLELSTHWCFELYSSFLWSFYCIPGLRNQVLFWTELYHQNTQFLFQLLCWNPAYVLSILLLKKKKSDSQPRCILKLSGEFLKTIQMPRPHSKPIILNSQGGRLSVCIFKCSYRKFQSYSQGWDHWVGVNQSHCQ